MHTLLYLRQIIRDCSSSPAAKLHVGSQHRGPGFDPWSGNYIAHDAAKTWHTQINKVENQQGPALTAQGTLTLLLPEPAGPTSMRPCLTTVVS